MTTTRRTFLKFCGGATAGAVVSPLPWKLLDDVSIWTQNWSWTARTARGPVSYMNTTCTLCPAGCGLHLRRIGECAVSISGVPGHPLNNGRLCPIGLGAAQILYHPARVAGAMSRNRGSDDPWLRAELNAAINEVSRKLAEIRSRGSMERVAVLDLRPNRSLSVLYREFLAACGGGRYLTLPGGRDLAAAALGDLMDLSGTTPGYDFSKAGAVISFGAPLFEGWSGAGAAPGLLPGGENVRIGKPPHIVQVEANGSSSTGFANSWLPIRPGTEAALALGLAHVFQHEMGMDEPAQSVSNGPNSEFWSVYADLVTRHTPRRVAEVTSIAPGLLRATARDLSRIGPVIAVGGGSPAAGPLGRAEELAIWALNLTLGSVGRSGGVVLRRDLSEIFAETNPPQPESIWDVPDGSLDLLLVDGMLPGTPLPQGLLRRKMAGPSSLMVGMSAFASGPVAGADLIIPTAAPGEWLDDVPPQALAAKTTYSLSPAFKKMPVWSLHPADLLARLGTAAGLTNGFHSGQARHNEVIHHRLEALMNQGRGEVFLTEQEDSIGLREVASPHRLEQILAAGGCWIESAPEPAKQSSLQSWRGNSETAKQLVEAAGGRLPETSDSERKFPLVLVLAGPAVATYGGTLPPVVNKLYRESNLMRGTGIARLNPATASANGLKEGRSGRLATPHGTMSVKVVYDESVRPGVVLMSPGPSPESMGDPDGPENDDILEICGAGQRPVWRVERAALLEV